MNITKETIKETLKTIMAEEANYKVFFKKALEKAGKAIPSMSDDEKKAFFNKIDKAWDAKGEKNEGNTFGAAVVAAKEAGEDEFEVDGEKFKVEESHSDCGCGCGGVTEGGCNTNSTNEAIDFAGWVAIDHKGKRLEIKKSEAKDLYNAKLLAIKKLKVPKSKESMLAIKPAYNESVNEASKEAMGIAALTGTRGSAVEDFILKHKLDGKKLFKSITKANLRGRLNFASALAGQDGNPNQKLTIKLHKNEVVNEAKEPEVITQLRKIVKDKQNALVVDTKSKKKVRVDMQSANVMVQVYDALKQQSNKDKFVKGGIVSMGHMAYKLMKNEDVNEGDGLWANIRAKKARGEKPAHKNSTAHKDAVKAGEKIKKKD